MTPTGAHAVGDVVPEVPGRRAIPLVPVMGAAQPAISIHPETSESEELTLLELVQAICEVTVDDREVVATVRHMLRSGRVRLSGNFRGSSIEAFR